MTAYTYGHARPGQRPVLLTTIEDTCTTCEGSGVVYVPLCRGGSDHAGRHCGGTVCDPGEAPCPDCGGDDGDR